MKLSKALLKEKTNVPVKATTTFNAPGTYIPPYGKTVVKIGGRGTSGNYSSGGNYAGETYAGEVYAGTNPTTYPYAGSYNTIYPFGGYNPPTPGNSIGVLYQYWSPYIIDTTNYYPGAVFIYNAYSVADDPPGYTHFVVYDTYYNPSTPGNVYYNTVPGYDYYNTVPGNAYYYVYYSPYYNPYYPGSAGTPSNIGGVYFPAGPADSLAPVVALTTTAIVYSTSGIPITVPSGGYITIQNI